MLAYVDGEEVDKASLGREVLSYQSEIPHIGAYKPGTQHFSGKIDEVRIYNRALDSSEVGALYRE